SGVELIFCRLHAGGKFSNDSYEFSGGLHGVGISVVSALSSRLEVTVRRLAQVHEMAFAYGDKMTELEVTGTCGQRNTGTRVQFWPDASYFDTPKFSVSRLKHLLKAKAVLCPGLTLKFVDKVNNETLEWYYEDGLQDYLVESVKDFVCLPEIPFIGNFKAEFSAVEWALTWLPEGGEGISESY